MPTIEERKSAALKTYILWAWLEKNPLMEKGNYYLFRDLHYLIMSYNCPWCDISKNCCKGCPLGMAGNICAWDFSLYQTWVNGGLYNRLKSKTYSIRRRLLVERVIAAGDIAALAWREYKKLGG